MQDEKLTTNRRKAIRALLGHSTVRAAAAACGLAERTLHHYLADPTFRAALRERQDELTAATAARLSGGVGDALATLEAVWHDPEATPAARVRAAVAWLKAWRDATMIDELTQRVAALEAR